MIGDRKGQTAGGDKYLNKNINRDRDNARLWLKDNGQAKIWEQDQAQDKGYREFGHDTKKRPQQGQGQRQDRTDAGTRKRNRDRRRHIKRDMSQGLSPSVGWLG